MRRRRGDPLPPCGGETERGEGARHGRGLSLVRLMPRQGWTGPAVLAAFPPPWPSPARGEGTSVPLDSCRGLWLASRHSWSAPDAHRALACLHRRHHRAAAHPRADGAARGLLCAGAGLAHGVSDGGRRGAGRFHGHDAVDARRRGAAGRLGDDLHHREVGRRGLSRLARREAVAGGRRAGGEAAGNRRVAGKDAGACLAGDGAQPEGHHLLRRLRAAVPVAGRRLRDADGGAGGDLRLARLRQRARLCGARRARRQSGEEPARGQRSSTASAAPASSAPAWRRCR